MARPDQKDFEEEILQLVSPKETLLYKRTSILKKKAAGNLRRIRKKYKYLLGKGIRSVSDHLIADHYYLFERETKGLLKELDGGYLPFGPHSEEPDLIGWMKCCLRQEDFSFETGAVIALIGQIEQKRKLKNFELDFLPAAIRFAALETIAEHLSTGERGEGILRRAIETIFAVKSVNTEAVLKSKNALEKLLCEDPAGEYARMNDKTRTIYRYKISMTAIKTGIDELELARQYLVRCRKENTHIGFPIYEQYDQLFHSRFSQKVYIPALFLTPAAVSVLLAVFLSNYWMICLLYFPLWALFKPLIDYICLLPVQSEYMPRMELQGVVPERGRTLITIATLLPNAKELNKLKSKLEKIYMTNKSGDVKIALLADLKESQYPTSNDDDLLVQLTKKMIRELNRKYEDSFVLLIRKRSYSKTQRVYTGYERKRGAIDTLIGMIKQQPAELEAFEGDRDYLSGVKYLYVLDYDTKALMDTAAELVSVALHPMNRPIIDSEKGIVVKGYGILAPRVGVDLKESLKTPFAKIMGGLGGISAYDKSCGDIYQDIFGEGIFAGKGLIDVDVFYEVLRERFPDEVVLSHDILEGSFLRTGFVSDVELLDGFPQSANAYFKRLHRWIRGDYQNIPYLLPNISTRQGKAKNPLNGLSKFKLFDNLRRELTPFIVLRCFLLAVFLPGKEAAALTAVSVLSVISGYLFGLLWTFFSGGFFSLSRKYYSKTLPQTFELLAQCCYELILLPKYAVSGLDAAIRAVWRRMVSKRKLMEWTTAAQVEKGKNGVRQVMRNYWYSIPLGLFLLIPGQGFLRIVGLLFLACIPLVLYSQRKYPEEKQQITSAQSDTVLSYTAAMWHFYQDYVGKDDHYLPPDNMQEAPVYTVAHRTSPTNIGLYLLSALAARDMNFIDTAELAERVGNTLTTVERMQKYHGNLYNWYHTQTLSVLEPQYVSTVDSGNFVCCLVALKEGLREFRAEDERIDGLVLRLEKVIDETDLSVFYDQTKRLFSIGYDSKQEKLSSSSYDMLMSEARMTSYFAIAKKLVPLKHWSALGRTLARMNFYTGPLSWTGTMFEYFMPELLLHCIDGSLGYEGLRFCLYCQKRRARQKGVPFGISESGYYAFDTKLNYQYRAFGVQKLALKKGQNLNTVISPYSSFLAMPYDFSACLQNLKRLREIGLYGKYGFYEAADFTPERVRNSRFQIVKSYMAHHVGMSIVAADNALNGHVMQQRFLADRSMNRANELLQEKVLAGAVVFDDIDQREEQVKNPKESPLELEYSNLYPQNPRVHFLSNGNITSVLTDCGASFLRYQDRDVTRYSDDLLRRPMGVFAWARAEKEVTAFSYAPDYDSEREYRVKLGTNSMTYMTSGKTIQTGMKVLLHSQLPCEQRQFVIQNSGAQKTDAELLIYLEPCLARTADDAAHPAFSKLFLRVDYDHSANLLVVSRRMRDGESGVYCAVGFLEDLSFAYEANRENLMERPDGVFSLNRAFDKQFTFGSGTPDPCIALKCKLSIPAKEQRECTLIISAGHTREQAINGIISIRSEGAVTDETAARPMIPADSLEGRLASSILPAVLFHRADSKAILEAVGQTALNKTALWQYGISGDLPIVLVEVQNDQDADRVAHYISCHKLLNMCHLRYDLVFRYADGGEYFKPVWQMLHDQVEKAGQGGMLDAFGGIHLVNTGGSENADWLLRAAACHLAPKTMVRMNKYTRKYQPIFLNRVLPFHTQEDREKNGFAIDSRPKLPWSHILANPAFGTLVSDKSLGFTWAINSRENKLTPWYNDTMSDQHGEMLIVRLNDRYYNLLDGAAVLFSPGRASYDGQFEDIIYHITVSVPQNALHKEIKVSFENRSQTAKLLETAYYTEPVLGVDRKNMKYISSEIKDGDLLLSNCFSGTMPVHMGMTAGQDCRFVFDRAAFWSGRWEESGGLPNYDPCGVLIVKKELPPKRKEKIDFTLAFSSNLESLPAVLHPAKKKELATENTIEIRTPDRALDFMMNAWLPTQVIVSRLYGRTGFYQCGGAFGYRDQLQDAANIAALAPVLTKRQILRAAASQFIEGDVLHWWHNMPPKAGGKKGVRTRYTDDLLWIVYAVCEYIEKTGDRSVLDIEVSYADGPVLEEWEKERYLKVNQTLYKEPVFRHCVRAIDKAYHFGRHGLVLMGCGDWNDGYNRVGAEGEGESVWLTQFLAMMMKKFSPICSDYGDLAYAQQLEDTAQKLLEAVETSAWDGEWYLRAYFDNGEKMGSIDSDECKIDSLSQSFSVLAGMPNREHSRTALNSAYHYLVDQENQIVKLFAPPYQDSKQEPGYVKAYPAGIRENGGQYTHASVWFAMALLRSGETELGYQVLKMLNPMDRYQNEQLASRYLTEPYYFAADVYTNRDAYGRGGWSLYTGAAGWYYKTVLEELLGIRIKEDALVLEPRLPKEWDGFSAEMTIRQTKFSLTVKRSDRYQLTDNGAETEKILFDKKEHQIVLEME